MHCQTLAEQEGVGRIVMCNSCTDVHVAVDSLAVRISQEGLMALSALIQKALRHPKIAMTQKDPREYMAEQLFSRT